MAKSKNRPAYKVKKKKQNIHKQKLKEMANEAKNMEQPLTFVYNREKQSVEVPIKAWQTLNQAADQLRGIALFVTTMELVGQQHMTDGTLLPVFKKDTEPSGVKNPDGTDQLKIKESFWDENKTIPSVGEKPSKIIVDGKTVYDAKKEVADPVATVDTP